MIAAAYVKKYVRLGCLGCVQDTRLVMAVPNLEKENARLDQETKDVNYLFSTLLKAKV